MIQTTDAVILRSTLFRETSQLLTFFTQEFGKIFTLAKGVRGRSPRFGSTFELFSSNRIVFYERGRSHFQLLSQCDLLDSFPSIRSDLHRTAYAVYFLELLDRFTEAGDRNQSLYLLLLEALRELSEKNDPEKSARLFEIKLLALCGLMPDLSSCQKCRGPITRTLTLRAQRGGVLCMNCFKGESQNFTISKGTLLSMRQMASSPWRMAHRIRMSRSFSEELEETLKRFIDFYLDERIFSRDFLKEVEAL